MLELWYIIPGLICLIITVFYVIKLKGNFSDWVLVYVSYSGIFVSITGISPDILRLFFEFSAYLLLIGVLKYNNSVKFWIFILSIIIFCHLFYFIVGTSFYINNILFIRRVLFFFTATYAYFNNQFKFKLFKHLFYIQIFASLIKLFFYGVEEDYVGFLVVNGGSTTIDFVVLSFLVFIKTEKSAFNIFFYSILLFLFGVINEKRIIVFIFPLLLLYIFKLKSVKLTYIIPIIIILPVLLIFSFNLITSFKDDNVTILNFVDTINDKYINPQIHSEINRSSASRYLIYHDYFVDFNLRSRTYTLGEGIGSTLISVLNGEDILYGSEEEKLISFFGLSYGARVGLFFLLINVGLVGFVFFIWIFVYYVRNILNVRIFSIALPIVIYLFYSKSIFENPIGVMLISFLFGLSIKHYTLNVNQLEVRV